MSRRRCSRRLKKEGRHRLAVASIVVAGGQGFEFVDHLTGVFDRQVRGNAQTEFVVQPIGQVELEPIGDRIDRSNLAGGGLAAVTATLVAGVVVIGELLLGAWLAWRGGKLFVAYLLLVLLVSCVEAVPAVVEK